MFGLEELGRSQFGLVSRAQALDKKLTRNAITWRLESGEWELFRRNVYRFRGASPSWSQAAMGSLLQAGTSSALSHQTAGFLFELDGLNKSPPAVIDVTAPRCVQFVEPGIRLHRSRDLALPTVVKRALTVTSLPRTLVDLASVLGEEDLEIALDSARRRHPTAADDLRAYVKTINPRRIGLSQLMQLLAKRERPLDSALEVKVSRAIDHRGLPRPIAGYSVYEARRYIMKIDFAWKDQRIALHADGYDTHRQRERFERDARQRALLGLAGWWNVTVTSRSLPDQAWSAAIQRTLEERGYRPPS